MAHTYSVYEVLYCVHLLDCTDRGLRTIYGTGANSYGCGNLVGKRRRVRQATCQPNTYTY